MTSAEFDEYIAARDHILSAFTRAARVRSEGWIERERLAVTIAANEWAASHGLSGVTVADVERVECRAVGHVDYATKLALYVVQLLYPPAKPLHPAPVPGDPT